MLGFAVTGAAIAALLPPPYIRRSRRQPAGMAVALLDCRPPQKQLALTYDDGPTILTVFVCSKFIEHRVRATFFMIGRYVLSRPDITREVAGAGHVIGNHTFTHPLLPLQSEAEIRKQLLNCHAALGDAIGEHSDLFRPPFGGRRPAVFRIARQLGLDPIMWNVTGLTGMLRRQR